MLQYAVFIEPEGELNAFIIKQKSRVQTCHGCQPYGSHPPHCSLYVSALGEAETWMSLLERTVRSNTAFVLRVQGTVVFYNDAMTGGGHTLALRAQRTDALGALQACVSEALAPYVDRKSIGNPSGFMAQEPYRASIVKYGYPFVGTHWIPHFTIASLLIPGDSPAIKAFEAQPVAFEQWVRSVSVWRIDNDRHERIATIGFGG